MQDDQPKPLATQAWDAVDEPAVTEQFRLTAHEKAAWMDRYVGILILRAHLDG